MSNYSIFKDYESLFWRFEINEKTSMRGINWILSDDEKELIKLLFKEILKDHRVIMYEYKCPNCKWKFDLPIIYAKSLQELTEENKDNTDKISYCTCILNMGINIDSLEDSFKESLDKKLSKKMTDSINKKWEKVQKEVFDVDIKNKKQAIIKLDEVERKFSIHILKIYDDYDCIWRNYPTTPRSINMEEITQKANEIIKTFKISNDDFFDKHQDYKYILTEKDIKALELQ